MPSAPAADAASPTAMRPGPGIGVSVDLASAIHPGFQCMACSVPEAVLRGQRYTCVTCRPVASADLCEACFVSGRAVPHPVAHVWHVFDVQDTLAHKLAQLGRLDVLASLLTGDDGAAGCVNAYGDTVAHVAAFEGNIAVLKLLQQRDPALLLAQDHQGFTPLHLACIEGHAACVQFLVQEAGADPVAVCHAGTSVAEQAGYGGHVDVLRLLLRLSGADAVPAAAVLRAACHRGHRSVVELLLMDSEHALGAVTVAELHEALRAAATGCAPLAFVKWLVPVMQRVQQAGFDLDARDHMGRSACFLAATAGRLDLVQWLIALQDVDSRQRAGNGDSLVHAAASSGRVDLVRWLLASGLTVDLRNDAQQTPLMLAAAAGHLIGVQELVTVFHASASVVDVTGLCPMLSAAWAGFPDVVAWLNDNPLAGQGIEHCDLAGRSVIHAAASIGCLQLLRWCLETQHMSVEQRTHRGATPLILAAAHAGTASAPTVTWLLKSGANAAAVAQDNATAFHWACMNGCAAAAELLLPSSGVDVDQAIRSRGGRADGYPVLLAAQGGHVDVLRLLHSAMGANMTVTDSDGDSAVHFAAAAGSVEALAFLINEVFLALDLRNCSGSTPLHRAVAAHQPQAAAWIIQRCEDANVLDAADHSGDTAILLAAAHGDLATLRRLAERGADVSLRNNAGNTVLHMFARRGSADGVAWVLHHAPGMDPDAANRAGASPLAFAAAAGQFPVVRLLLDRFGPSLQLDRCVYRSGEAPITVLAMAARGGAAPVVDALLQAGARVPTLQRQRLLVDCARRGHVGVMRAILRQDGTRLAGEPVLQLLHAAVRYRSVEVIQYLAEEHDVDLEARLTDATAFLAAASVRRYPERSVATTMCLTTLGADPTAVTTESLRSAVFLAASQSNLPLVAHLVEAIGLDASQCDVNGATPLHVAAAASEPSLPLLQYLLLQCRADPDALDAELASPLHWAARSGVMASLRYLLSVPGVNPRRRTRRLETLLHMAAGSRSAAIVRMLLRTSCVDVDSQTLAGRTSLHVAAAAGAAPVIAELVSAGANVDIRVAGTGPTAVLIALQHGHLNCVQTLFASGASLTLSDVTTGATGVHVAAQAGDATALAWLLQRVHPASVLSIGAGTACATPLLLAVRAGSASAVRVLLDAGADLCDANADGEDAFAIAAASGNVAVMSLLTSRAQSNRLVRRRQAELLHQAAKQGHQMMIAYLMSEHGCSKYALDQRNATPLHTAVRHGRSDLALWLIDTMWMDVNVIDGDAATPLIIAAACGNEGLVRALLLRGARIDQRDVDCRTAACAARAAGHVVIAAILDPINAPVHVDITLHVAAETGRVTLSLAPALVT